MAESNEDFRLISALYWGEGDKNYSYFGFSNCDPTMLTLVVHWLINNGYGHRVKFTVRAFKENGRSQLAIKRWWIQQIPALNLLEQVGPVYFNKVIRSSQRVGKNKQPNGTAYIVVGDVSLKSRVMGGINFLKHNFFSTRV